MPITQMDRLVIEVRDLLAEMQNKDTVVRVLTRRGMAEDEARDLVYAIYKQTRWENRKMSLAGMFGSGLLVVILLVVWFATGRLFYVWLPLSALAFLWATVKFCTASGYDFEESDD